MKTGAKQKSPWSQKKFVQIVNLQLWGKIFYQLNPSKLQVYGPMVSYQGIVNKKLILGFSKTSAQILLICQVKLNSKPTSVYDSNGPTQVCVSMLFSGEYIENHMPRIL